MYRIAPPTKTMTLPFQNLAARALLVAVLAITCAAACRRLDGDRPVVFNPDEGGTMSTALGLFFDLPIDDRLNSDVGDDVDWRYILVAEPGVLSVNLNVDNPYMMGFWDLRDGMGRVMFTERLDPRKGYYEAINVPVEPGRYYFHIESQKGSSIYTVGAAFITRDRNIADVAYARNNQPTQTINGAGLDETKIVIVDDSKVPKPKGKPRPKPKEEPVAVVDNKPLRVYTGTLNVATGEKPQVFSAYFRMDSTLDGLDLTAPNIQKRAIVGKNVAVFKGVSLTIEDVGCTGDLCKAILRANKEVVVEGLERTAIVLQIEVYPPPPGATPPVPDPGVGVDPTTNPVPPTPGAPNPIPPVPVPGVPDPTTPPVPVPGVPDATTPPVPVPGTPTPTPPVPVPGTPPGGAAPIVPNLDGAEPPPPGSDGLPG